jgi:tetratricopeptide (TPR) repeat protein
MKELDDIIVEDVLDVFESREKIRETLGFVRESYDNYVRHRRKRLVLGLSATVTGIAAVLFLSLMIIPSLTRLNTETIFNSAYRKFQVDVNTRSIEKADLTSAAAALYNQGDYSGALARLDSLLVGNPKNSQVLFIKGLTKMETGEYDAAGSLLSQVAKSGGSFEINSQWYLAMIHLKQGNIDVARQQFGLIKSAKNNPYRKQAAKIYRRLRFRNSQ